MANEALQRRTLNLDPFNSLGEMNVVIETPKKSYSKYKYDAESGLFRLDKLMPTGTVFPFDFGFLPSTLGADGDPLDVLILIDEPVPVGCLVAARLIGVIEAQQTENGKTRRNDRLIGVATASHLHQNVRSLRDVNSAVLDEIERFFVFYNKMQDRMFKALGRHGAAHARKVILAGEADFERNSKAGN